MSIGNLMQKSKPVRNGPERTQTFVLSEFPDSGKSSILAAVMHQLQKSGDLVPAKNIDDMSGAHYSNYLRRCEKQLSPEQNHRRDNFGHPV